VAESEALGSDPGLILKRDPGIINFNGMQSLYAWEEKDYHPHY